MKLVLIPLIALGLVGCTSPAPQIVLETAVAVLDTASLIPTLTPLEQAWISGAAGAMACSAKVLGAQEPVSQEASDIANCVASIPAIPASSQKYVLAAIRAVTSFIDLFVPTPTVTVQKSNRIVHTFSINRRADISQRLRDDAAHALAVKGRVDAHK